MLEIIAQYWLNFLLTLISGGLILLCKKLWNLYQNEKQNKKTKETKTLQAEIEKSIKQAIEESKRGDETLQKQIDIIKDGVLSIQKVHFKKVCKDLLKEGHEITMEEFESVTDDHNTYNALGGNHDGDTLFEMVKRKAGKNLTD